MRKRVWRVCCALGIVLGSCIVLLECSVPAPVSPGVPVAANILVSSAADSPSDSALELADTSDLCAKEDASRATACPVGLKCLTASSANRCACESCMESVRHAIQCSPSATPQMRADLAVRWICFDQADRAFGHDKVREPSVVRHRIEEFVKGQREHWRFMTQDATVPVRVWGTVGRIELALVVPLLDSMGPHWEDCIRMTPDTLTWLRTSNLRIGCDELDDQWSDQ